MASNKRTGEAPASMESSKACANPSYVKPKKDSCELDFSVGRLKQYEKANEVLRIPELLENILVHLDFKAMLFAQRVSKTWFYVVGDSTVLPKKLFLIPATFEEVVDMNSSEENGLIIAWSLDNYNDAPFTPPLNLVHPFLTTLVDEDVSDYPHHLKLADRILEDMISARRGKSSWENMYITQPPLEYILGSTKTSDRLTDLRDTSWCEEGTAHEFDFTYMQSTSMRGFLDSVEESALYETGSANKWRELKVYLNGVVMSVQKWNESSGFLLPDPTDSEHGDTGDEGDDED